MAPNIPSVKLHDGTPDPVMGFGLGTTWYYAKNKDRFGPFVPECVEITKKAIEAGYRHLDTSEMYGTEAELGAAIKESGVPREDFFVCTKVNEGMADIPKALEASLEKMQTDYVDLYLIHQPFFAATPADLQNAWRSMEALQRAGKAKAIGVSNFSRADMEIVLATADIKPAVIQFEYHPYHPRVREGYVPWLQRQGLVVEAFFGLVPLTYAKGGPLDAPLAAIAEKHGVDKSVVLQRWLLEQDVVSLNTTSRAERITQAFGALDFRLSDEEMEQLTSAGQKEPKAFVGPSGFNMEDQRQYL